MPHAGNSALCQNTLSTEYSYNYNEDKAEHYQCLTESLFLALMAQTGWAGSIR